MLYRLILFIVLVGTLGVSRSWADDPIFYSFVSEDGHYNFDGGFVIKADPSVVWDVLTDYNHYNRYISNIKAKVLKQKPGEDLLVEQDAGGGFLFIQEHIKARLDVHEIPGQSISFQDIDHQHFTLYAGVWSLQYDPQINAVRVSYALQATRSKMTPEFLTADLFGSSLGDLLNEMKREMDRRELKRKKQMILAAKSSVTPTAVPTVVANNSGD